VAGCPAALAHPRTTLEEEAQEKARGAVKGWSAKPGAGQHRDKWHAHCEGHILVKHALKLQYHFANFLRVCHEPFYSSDVHSGSYTLRMTMNQHSHVLGLMNFLFCRQIKDLLQTSFHCSPSIFSILHTATDFISFQKQRCHKGCVQRQVAKRADTSGLQIPKKCYHKYLLILEPCYSL